MANSKDVKCVIFDKDGTLVDFHKMWLPWAVDTVRLCEAATKMPVGSAVYKTLGVDPHLGKVSMGALAEKTLDGIRADVATTLQQFGFHSTHTEKIVKTCVPEASPGLAAPVCDLDILFRELKEMDIKIALCTADSRRATEEQMQILGIEHMLDDVVCGNDKGIIPKPSPHCAIQICKRLGVELDEAVMVGDTIADLKMGRVAGLRASVAVLSGVGTRETLSEYTDYYLDDASTLPSLIRDEIHQDFYNKRG